MYARWGIVLGLDISDFIETAISDELQQLLDLFEEPNACVCTYDETVNSFGVMLITQNTFRRAFWYDSSEGVLLNAGDWTVKEQLLIEQYDLMETSVDEVLAAHSDELVFAVTDHVAKEAFFAFDSEIEVQIFQKPGANPFDIQWLRRFFT
jgi:hypothetical protein